MKNILLLKQIDLAGQLLMLAPLGFLFTNHPERAFLCYFTVGAWQTISALATAILGLESTSSSRTSYNKMLAFVLGAFAVFAGVGWMADDSSIPVLEAVGSVGFGAAFIEAALMLFISPVMAGWYAQITGQEIRLLRMEHNTPTGTGVL